MSFLGLLLGLAFYLFGLGFLGLLFDGGLYGAELEELLPLVSLPSVSQTLLLLGWERGRETVSWVVSDIWRAFSGSQLN